MYIHSIPLHHIFLTTILVLDFHLCPGLLCLFFSGFPFEVMSSMRWRQYKHQTLKCFELWLHITKNNLPTQWRYIGGVEIYLCSFLISAYRWSEWLTSRWGRFTPEEITPVPTYWEAGRAPEPVLTFWRRENSSCLDWDSNSRLPIP